MAVHCTPSRAGRLHVALALGCAAAAALPQLPRLNVVGNISVSGISSGADLAVQFHIANSDIVNGSGIFAGQAYMCAVTRFDGEPETTCAKSPSSPGCGHLNTTAPGPCVGCGAGATVGYDHCKTPAWPEGPGWTQVDRLVAGARAAAASGAIPPLAFLRGAVSLLYHGTHDDVYRDGSVNNTHAFFAALVAAPEAQLRFEASVPSGHCTPSVDPAVDPASCGGHASKALPGLENCGYDGAGAMVRRGGPSVGFAVLMLTQRDRAVPALVWIGSSRRVACAARRCRAARVRPNTCFRFRGAILPPH